jgi:hypothetical protein
MSSEIELDIDYNSRNADKFVVRLPQGMRKQIAKVAKNYHRSMNSEIISRLESSLSVDLLADHQKDIELREKVTTELTREEFMLVEQSRKLSPDRRMALIKFLLTITS